MQHLDLLLETLLVLVILLLMLALDDLLGLLGDSVKLDILGPLFKVKDLEEKLLALVLNPLKLLLVMSDLLHLVDLALSTVSNLVVFILDYLLVDENGILIVSGDWKLRYFYLSLFHVNHDLKVILELLASIGDLTKTGMQFIILILNFVLAFSQVVDEALEVVETSGVLLLNLVHFDSQLPLTNKVIKLVLKDIRLELIPLEVVFFRLLFELDLLLDSSEIESAIGV